MLRLATIFILCLQLSVYGQDKHCAQAYAKAAEGAKKRTGFTLIEVLATVSVMGLTAALLLPAIQKVRIAALEAKCSNSQRNLGLALHHFAENNDGRIPTDEFLIGSLNPYLENNTAIYKCPFAPKPDGVELIDKTGVENSYGYNYSLGIYPNGLSRPRLLDPNIQSSTQTIAFVDSLSFDENPNGSGYRAAFGNVANPTYLNGVWIRPSIQFRHPGDTVQGVMFDGHVQKFKDKFEPSVIPRNVSPAETEFRRKYKIYSLGRDNRHWNGSGIDPD